MYDMKISVQGTINAQAEWWVVEGMDLVRKMETVGSEDGDTSNSVVIKDCGMAK